MAKVNVLQLSDAIYARWRERVECPSRAAIAETVRAFAVEVEQAVRRGERVHLYGFGYFEAVEHAPRRILTDGQEINLDARRAMKFRAAAQLRDLGGV